VQRQHRLLLPFARRTRPPFASLLFAGRQEDIPIVIDHLEENIDNQTIFRNLGKCIKKAKERWQVIMVTHSLNLAVVCDAEQIVYASPSATFNYEAGAIELSEIKGRINSGG
jgi:hypothetical protein